MLRLVVARYADLLALDPDAVLPSDSIAARKPAETADLPFISVGLNVDAASGSPLGRTLHLDDSRREPRTGDLYAGVLQIDVWAAQFAALDEVSGRLQRRLRVAGEAARARGFLRLSPASMEAAEYLLVSPPVGAAFPAWRQTLIYRFACEVEDTEPPSEGGPIKRIDVASGIAESFTVA